MRYYSTLRPISHGTYPKYPNNKVTKIVNYNFRQLEQDINRQVWGYLEYEKPIPEDDAYSYDLVPRK